MIDLQYIKQYYPQNLHGFERELLREYLQCEMLQILFDSAWGNKFAFLGGTCLRIVHDNTRFSEDLDFDNFEISSSEFDHVAEHMEKELRGKGYEVEMRVTGKGAYHCYIKFPSLLYDQGLSAYKEEKILIQLDTESQRFGFTPQSYILDRFGIFSQLNITPSDVILAQKCYAVLNRPRNKGRDFFDIVFLLSRKIKPNYQYLEQKIGISTSSQLKEQLIAHCEKLDMNEQGRDVSKFLFNPNDVRRVTLFPDILKQADL